MADQFQYAVFDGIWINWSYGRVLGATFTLPQSQATLLIAFAAFFITVIGSSLWRILCFILFHLFSNPVLPRDALHHQRQATLRNSRSPLMGVTVFSSLAWYWRKDGQRIFARVIPILVGAILIAVGLAVASGFSSRIARDNEILIASSDCHWTTSTFESGTAMTRQSDMIYARDCYSLPMSTSSHSLGCNSYIHRRLPYTVKDNASCPFAKEICKTEYSIQLDTGYLDSHADLGLNAPPLERFKYRTTLHCAPITTENYTTTYNSSATRSFTRYHYGQDLALQNDFVYQASNDDYTERKADNSTALADYSLTLEWAPYINGTIYPDVFGWVPIPELDVPDSYLALAFLGTNSLLYEDPVHDPWYEATNPEEKIRYYADNSTRILYAANNPGSPLGCVSREQYCTAQADGSVGRCTNLTGPYDLAYSAKETFTDQQSLNRFNWYSGSIASAPNMLIEILSTIELNLISRSTILYGRQVRLSDQYWQAEVEYWFATIMAALQRLAADAARGGEVAPDNMKWLRKPNNIEEKTLCSSQKVLSPYHTSFSLFGILFVFTFGILVIILSLSLESLARCFSKHRKVDSDKCLEWALNETLQLQRLAHEGIGIGLWSRGAELIPLEHSDATLGILDASDPKHPRLQTSPVKYEKSGASSLGIHSNMLSGEGAETDTNPDLVRSSQTRDPETSLTSVQSPREHAINPQQDHQIDRQVQTHDQQVLRQTELGQDLIPDWMLYKVAVQGPKTRDSRRSEARPKA